MTVDFDTLEDHAVTVRERDSMKQERVRLDQVAGLPGRAAARLLTCRVRHGSGWRPCTMCACFSPARALPSLALTGAALVLPAAAGTRARAVAGRLVVRREQRRRRRPRRRRSACPRAEKLTDQGSKLSFGDTGTVIFESTQSKGTVLRLTVKSVQRGRLSDFKGFILDDIYKKNAPYYYATVQVRQRRRRRRRGESACRCGG